MRTLRTIGLLGLCTLLASGTPTPVAAADKCVAAIAAALAKAATKNFKAALKGQPATVTLVSKKIDKACTAPPGGYTGCPGTAGCPNDTDATVEGYEACVNCALSEIAEDVDDRTNPGTCGNKTKDADEECETDADCPSGTCGAPGTATQCTCTSCGNKSLERGEECDPGAQPITCCAGTTCVSSGVSACTCVGPCQGFSRFEFTIGQGTPTCSGVCSLSPTRTCYTDEGCASEAGGSLGTCNGKACSFAFSPCTTDADCINQAAGEQCLTLTPPEAGGKSGEITYNTGSKGPLGKGCLYFGGGNNRVTPPAPIPDGSVIPFNTVCGCSSVALTASDGTGPASCSRGVASTKHCIDGATGTDGQGACATDADCHGTIRSCAPDARCYFGPPLPIAGGPAPTCLLNVFSQDASGTLDPVTGEASISINLFSRIFAQNGTQRCHNGAPGDPAGNSPGFCQTDADCGGDVGSCRLALPCPTCVNNKCIGGARHGLACTAVGSKGTTLDCPLEFITESFDVDASYLATLSVTLGPLTTGTNTRTADADAKFCTGPQDPGAKNPGAFGQGLTQGSLQVTSISETGEAAGDLRDLAAHAGTLAYTFCIPATGDFIDNIASLPGPGAVALPGTFQLKP